MGQIIAHLFSEIFVSFKHDVYEHISIKVYYDIIIKKEGTKIWVKWWFKNIFMHRK